MGAQSSSHFKSITNIHQQLLNIETTLSNAEASDLWRRMQIREGMAAGATNFVRKDDVFLYGTHLACRPGVRVLCGPVVGKVTDTSAKVLLEVNASVEVTCYVAIFQDDLPTGRMIMKQTKPLEARKPEVFHIRGLAPGQRYNVCFDGVCADDAVGRVARFTTLGGPHRAALRIALVGNNRREDCMRGEENLWETLASEVSNPKAEIPIEMLLHLGNQSFPASGDITGDWVGLTDLIQRRAAERMRWSWNFPHTRAVLAACSNLCVCGEGERGLGRKIFTEYQDALARDPKRKLTQAESKIAAAKSKSSSETFETVTSYHFIQKVGCLAIVNLHLHGGKRAFSGEADTVLPNTPFITPHQWTALEDLFEDDEIKGLVVACEVPLVYMSPSEVEQCEVLGNTEFRTNPGSQAAADWEVILADIRKGWSAKENEKDLHRLLGFLFQWKKAGNGQRDCVLACGGTGAAAQTEIFDSKTKETVRQVCVGCISRAPSTFLPSSTGQLGGYGKRFQYVHRPLSASGGVDATKAFATLTFSNVSRKKKKKSHAHRPLWPTWDGVQIDVKFVQANQRVPLPCGVCGPIIGEVTTSSAVVLLEVERDAAVRCILRNSLDGSTHEQVQSLKAGEIHAFKFDGLYPQRRYDVSFQGIADAIHRTGVVTTHAMDPNTPFSLVCVTNNDPYAGIMRSQRDRHLAAASKKAAQKPVPTPWELLKYRFQIPWSAPQIMLHTGSQIQADRHLLSPQAQAIQGEYSNMTPEDQLDAESRVYDVVADGYRSCWDLLASTKAVLGMCPNVMMCGATDVGAGFGMPRGGQAAVLTKQAKKAFQYYQRQLWDPHVSQRALHSASQSESHFHQYGAVAVFCFDLRSHRVDSDGIHRRDAPFINQEQWDSFERVLRLPSVRTLILVSESPFIKDSPADARVKDALDPSLAYIRQTWPYNGTHLERLLKTVFDWKREHARREVVLLANCDGAGDSGVETTVTDINSPSTEDPQSNIIKQFLVPALMVDPSVASAGFVCEKEGGLFERFTYRHQIVTRKAGIARLTLTPVPGKRDTLDMDLAVNTTTTIGVKPDWVDNLLGDGAHADDETDEEREVAFKVRSCIESESFTAAADGSSPLLQPGERSALDELRHGWSKTNRVQQWRKALRILFMKGCSGIVRRNVLFPSDDVIHAIHRIKGKNYASDLDLNVAGFLGQASDMFAKQAVVALRLRRMENERRRFTFIPEQPNADENAIELAVSAE